jgi:hypothetical protein
VEPVFHEEKGFLVPTEYATGPWEPTLLHGGATAAVLVREAERLPSLVPMRTVRITAELFRPVRLSPLRPVARVLREGKKLRLLEVSLFDGDLEVASGRVLRLRLAGEEPSELPSPDGPPPPPPETGRRPIPLVDRERWFFNAFETRAVEGDILVPGPAAVWFRLVRPLVEAEPPSPAMFAAAVGDFGNGISAVLDRREWTFVNPDVSVYLAREPRGQWLCLRAATRVGPEGIGLAEGTLWDREGPVGRQIQSLLLERRSEPIEERKP